MADDIQPNKTGDMPVFGAVVGLAVVSTIMYFIIQWMGSGMTRDY